MSVAKQIDIFERIAWTHRERHLARLLEAVERVGHLREPEYSQGSLAWPRLRTWKPSAVILGTPPAEPIAAYLQTRGPLSQGPSMTPTARPQCRYLLVSLDGYVLAEGDWCTTEGGARGWLNRSTVKWGQR